MSIFENYKVFKNVLMNPLRFLNFGGDFKRAISAPIKQIASNTGFDDSNGKYVDMFEAGIIDPLKVARIALQNAVSVSSLLLTTEATVHEIKENLSKNILN